MYLPIYVSFIVGIKNLSMNIIKIPLQSHLWGPISVCVVHYYTPTIHLCNILKGDTVFIVVPKHLK